MYYTIIDVYSDYISGSKSPVLTLDGLRTFIPGRYEEFDLSELPDWAWGIEPPPADFDPDLLDDDPRRVKMQKLEAEDTGWGISFGGNADAVEF